VIRNCTVRNGANAGIEVFESDDALVTHNIVHDNAREGVRLIEAFDSEVIDNVSRDNGGNGIAVFEGANNLVRLNTVKRNKLNGIDVCFDTRLNRVDRNDTTGSGMAGILICDGATDSAVTKNRSVKNTIDVLDESVGNGTVGTDTMWRNNTCGIDPTGLCRFIRRVRSSSSSSSQ
jgi:parallel beta-helix repeat protein